MRYMHLLLTQIVVFQEIHVFLLINWSGLLEQREPNTTLKIPRCTKNFLWKLSLLSQRNNVLDAAASNRDGFLWRDTCVTSAQLNRLFSTKMSIYPPWKLWFAGRTPFKK
jgi:hypothetical protein